MRHFQLLLLILTTIVITLPQSESLAAPESKNQRWTTLWGESPTEILVPEGYRPPTPDSLEFGGEEFTLRLFAREFAQGDLVYVEFLPHSETIESLTLQFQDDAIPLTRFDWGYRGFFPIHTAADVGAAPLFAILRRVGERRPESRRFEIEIRKRDFPESQSRMDLGNFSNPTIQARPNIQEFIAESSRRRSIALSSRSPDLIGSQLAHPRDLHRITSPFWIRRTTERYRVEQGQRVYLEPRVSIHRGLDLRGFVGDPIFAMADGTVVLAEELHFEGLCTIIDHGNRFYTIFMHQSELLVEKGDRVAAGQLVGHSGATGAVTAAHLHVSLFVRGVHLDPLSLLSLPVRGATAVTDQAEAEAEAAAQAVSGERLE